MKKGLALASSLGVTMMHTYAAEIWHYDEDFADYVARSDRGELPVRMARVPGLYVRPGKPDTRAAE